MTTHFNKTIVKDARRRLRNNMPYAERLLWARLRNRSVRGHKFRRQYSVENFVVDFYCPQGKLAIEIDGESHYREGAEEADCQRQRIIESFGIKFLRFTNTEVYENLDGVMERISMQLG